MNDAALLRVEELSVALRRAQRRAVEASSLELAPGRCLGVIGESGAGKTQAFLAMMGLLPPQARVHGPRASRGRRSAGRRRGARCAAGASR